MLIPFEPDSVRLSRALTTQPGYTVLVVLATAAMLAPATFCTTKVPEQPSDGAL